VCDIYLYSVLLSLSYMFWCNNANNVIIVFYWLSVTRNELFLIVKICYAFFCVISSYYAYTYFSVVRVTRSLVLCAMFCRLLFVLLSFSWPLCCLSVQVLQILITSLWYLQTLLDNIVRGMVSFSVHSGT
jgi:hypothetical protein